MCRVLEAAQRWPPCSGRLHAAQGRGTSQEHLALWDIGKLKAVAGSQRGLDRSLIMDESLQIHMER